MNKLIIFTSMFLCGCSGTSGKEYIMGKIAVQIPNEIEVTSNSPVEDFEIYSFKKDSKIILSVYFGNQTRFPSGRVDSNKKTDAIINTMPAQIIAWETGSDLSNKEMLLHVSEESWPRVAHFYYHNLSDKQAKYAERIMQSVHKANGNVGGNAPGQ